MKYPAVLLPLALAGASACTVQSDATELANPAATFCVEQGGTYALSQPDGAGGTCTLPDGRVVDAWDFLRANSNAKG
jgi:putative hemolysin